MKQHCTIWMIWGTWISLPALAVAIGVYSNWMGGLFVLLVGIVAQVAYLRVFPRVSRIFGYGSVEDAPADSVDPSSAPDWVTLYTASVCPFCPIVKQRLERLQSDLGFEINEIDITFRPDLIREKKLRSVPIVEVNNRFLYGNATSAQLAAFIKEAV